jgi:predicted nucleic acid-binding protein
MIFVDTWAWVALANGNDGYHLAARNTYKQLLTTGRTFFTTDYVLAETVSALYSAIGPTAAQRFLSPLMAPPKPTTGVRRVQVTAERFNKAWSLRQQLSDKPDISFVDLSSMVVMQELHISEIFTGDNHFRAIGLGFRLLPERA